ncbi:response regulator [Methanoregula sp.]|uniref:response regulator n=1 Tax=Methanoregula sp. TaxID=2052170 RepID=UPI00236AE14B|nr:response regulator [Methanoregula sp.]MDD1686732.1 response regulator [Methanoregula sp.]
MISVLYVDDDRVLLEISKQFLEAKGHFHIDTAESADKALEILNTRVYDAIISDYQMPVMDGIEFLKIVHNKFPTLPVIMFSGKDRDEMAIIAYENGAEFYLQKSGDPKAMFAELSHIILKSVEQSVVKRALKENAIRLLRQIQTASDFVSIVDYEGQIVYDPPSASFLLGYPQHFFIGKHISDFIHPDDRNSFITAFDHIRNGGKPGIPFGFRVRKADGGYLDVDSIAMNLIGIHGVDGIVVTAWPVMNR